MKSLLIGLLSCTMAVKITGKNHFINTEETVHFNYYANEWEPTNFAKYPNTSLDNVAE